jgi:glycosyltransferase involved in cell wall biosynthesis
MKTPAPLFSVVIPLYNRAQQISLTIQSVLAQTCQDFEIVIIDDGSTDNPQPVVMSFQDERIRYLRQDNAGGSAARNAGINMAKGRYIAFLDSDDVWLPNHLEQALPFLEAGNGKVATYSQIIVERGDGLTFIKPPRAQRGGEPFSEYLLCDRGFVQTSSLCVPNKIAKDVKFSENLRYGQDTDFALRLHHAGVTFTMLCPATTRWNDLVRADRTSNNMFLNNRERWIANIQPIITPRAHDGVRGWVLAQAYAQEGFIWKAAKLYLRASVGGAYTPKMAIVVGLQVFISRRMYRIFSNFLAWLGIKP